MILFQLKEKFHKFMQGRYGIDQLYVTSLVVYFILLFFSRWVDFLLIDFLMSFIIIWAIYRIFSKNIPKRYQENQRLLKFLTVIKKNFKRVKMRVLTIRTHRYKTCPNCRTTLRLKRKRGKHRVKCPKCQQSVRLRNFF
ncbi:hypothetical protein SAMN05421734_10471 [Pelagirhabdus alkalitolerans]|uniref:Zn-finger containing protein n=1 Tax=Pelagirhabdus alkalitolerans TaxID=1612202 RepID=A0A1G6IN71_9BACI|nr:hypothetical protein SAMN05421734_10471 [Pelagirhabdus alkalitolerans]